MSVALGNSRYKGKLDGINYSREQIVTHCTDEVDKHVLSTGNVQKLYQ